MSHFGASVGMPGAIDLSLGHSCHKPPELALQAAAATLVGGSLGYLAPGGLAALREALATKLQKQNEIRVSWRDVIVTGGASLGIFSCLAFLAPPDSPVLIPDPGFPLYKLVAETLRLRPISYSLRPEKGWLPDLDQLPGAPIMLWNSPHNPVGVVADPAFVVRLSQAMREREMWLISDEVYEDIVFTGRHASPAVFFPERTFSVFSFSKTYGMAGMRVGYVATPSGHGDALSRVHWSAAMSASVVAQYAALAALKAGAEYRQETLEWLRTSLSVARSVLDRHEIPYVQPQGSLYLWVDVRRYVEQSEAFCKALARTEHVLVSPGTHFGPSGEGYIRVCFSASDSSLLAEGLTRLCRFLRTWKIQAPNARGSLLRSGN